MELLNRSKDGLVLHLSIGKIFGYFSSFPTLSKVVTIDLRGTENETERKEKKERKRNR